jgi:cytochrome c
MRKFSGFILVIFITACASIKLISPTQADADRGAQKFSNLTFSDLNNGKMLYEQDCAECHRLKLPESKKDNEWNTIVPQMVKKANQDAGYKKIKANDQELILHYLITMSTVKNVIK